MCELLLGDGRFLPRLPVNAKKVSSHFLSGAFVSKRYAVVEIDSIAINRYQSMKSDNKEKRLPFSTASRGSYFVVLALLTCLFFSPVCIKFVVEPYGDTWFSTLRAGLICTGLASVILLFRSKAVGIAVSVPFVLTTLAELVMVNSFHIFMDIDHFLALITTTPEESATFASSNLHALCYLLPTLLLFIGGCVYYAKSPVPTRTFRWRTCAICLAIALIGIMPWEKAGQMANFYSFKSEVFCNTLHRPPFNIFHLTKVSARKLHRMSQSNDFVFGSTRTRTFAQKETYVLAIGESVRYANCSLNGHYPRQTMPLLEQQPNLIFFHNYYTGGCTTSVSVPMIVTRATAEDNALSYTEKSIVQVFKENGFTTFVIKRGLFSQLSAAYLYQGVDYTVEVASDAEVMRAVDSVSMLHDKTFIMFQLLGSHFYYGNFPKEFDRWHPNNQSDKNVQSDSLLINAYDNTILYTDFLLSNLIDTLQHRGMAALWYVSDHGQTITATTGWHGTLCNKDEYHVPLFVWYSDAYQAENDSRIQALARHIYDATNADCLFYTICGMANILLPPQYRHNSWDISSDDFMPHPRKVLINGEARVVE